MIEVNFEGSGLRRGRGELRRFTREVLGPALDETGWPEGEVSVLFCSDKRIRLLNDEFRRLDEATDVLSFPNAEDVEELRGEPAPYLGDLAIALPYTARQAAQHRHTVADEVALLLVHGFLHLLGWNHATKASEQAMRRETGRLLSLSSSILRPHFSDLEDSQ